MRQVFAGLLHGGLLALGITVGVCLTIVLLIFAEIFDIIPLADSAFTGAIFGALVAGAIGVAGQLLMMAQSELIAERARKAEERAKLERLLNRIVRILSVLAQVKLQNESSKISDIINFHSLTSITKPIIVNDIPDRLPEDLITLSLTLSNQKLFNLLNILDSTLANFAWAHKLYQGSVDDFLTKVKGASDLKFEGGAYSGIGLVDTRDHAKIQEVWLKYTENTYCGLVVAKRISEIVVGYLADNHGVKLDFSDRISSDEWATLIDSVDLGDFESDMK